jgi:Transcriptional regulatory protein, C terminal
MELERSSISLRILDSSYSGSLPKLCCSPDQYHSPRQGVTAPYTTIPGVNGQLAMFIRMVYGWPFTRFRAVIHLTSSPSCWQPTKLSAGDVTMDLLTREVTRGEQKIELQSREFALLELLLRHPGRPATKTMILEQIWDYSFDPQTNVVDVLVHRRRAKVDKDFPVKLIQTIRGVGYVFKPA